VKFSATSNTRLIGHVNFITRKSPQQINGYDCGMYVLATATQTAQAITNGEEIQNSAVDITPYSITLMRQEILNTIDELIVNSHD